MSPLAFLFPGQGAQAEGMGKVFYDTSPEAREIYKRANAYLGYDIAELCFEGGISELTRTEICQPALLVTGYAAFAAYVTRSAYKKPVGMSGLSLGEITALLAADSLSLKDALYFVQVRASAMQECAQETGGAMVALLGASPEVAEQLCRESGAYTANYNSPEQVVLSGTVDAINKAYELAKELGAKRAIKLEVSGAFHCPLMNGAAEKVKQALQKISIHKSSVPVISNVTGRPHEHPEQIQELLIQQIVSPVRWVDCVQHLKGEGAEYFMEFPPARVLTGLVMKILPDAKAFAVNSSEDFSKVPS